MKKNGCASSSRSISVFRFLVNLFFFILITFSHFFPLDNEQPFRFMLLLIIEDIVTEKSLIHISFYSDLTISYFFTPHGWNCDCCHLKIHSQQLFLCFVIINMWKTKHSSAAFCVIQTNYCSCVSFFSFHYHFSSTQRRTCYHSLSWRPEK